jgi:hypothetical protein
MSESGTTDYGFIWGPVEITRLFGEKGWVTFQVKTNRHPDMQIYVTKTGKVRVFSNGKEWFPKSKPRAALAKGGK